MEFVYVVKRYDLFSLEFPYGFVGINEPESADKVKNYIENIKKYGLFIQRSFTEKDSSFKQIIPYGVVNYGNEIFMLKRLDTQCEKRLHNKSSIGVGGHINPIDGTEEFLDMGSKRELEEELQFNTPYKKEIVGIINDDSVEVGSVHLGIVYLVTPETKDVTVRETDMMEGKFTPINEVKELNKTSRDSFETWSQLIIDKIDMIIK